MRLSHLNINTISRLFFILANVAELPQVQNALFPYLSSQDAFVGFLPRKEPPTGTFYLW